MGKRLISLLVGLSFCVEVIGIDYLSNFSSDMSYALRPMAAAVSENIKRIELKEGIGYETEELPLDLMQQLPGLKKNERIAKIRIARGKIAAQVCKETGLASSTYSHIENTDSLPSPRNLYKISRVLKIDLILIIEGKEWNQVKKYKEDHEKTRLLRLRKGKTQLDIVKDLGEAGLQFGTDNQRAERTRYSNWENRKATPFYGDRVIIAKVLGDDTLFDIPGQFKGDIELKIMPGLPIHTKSLLGLAFYWKKIRGCTPTEVAKIIGVKDDSLWSTLRRYGEEDMAEFYGIILPEKHKRAGKKIRPPNAEEGLMAKPKPAEIERPLPEAVAVKPKVPEIKPSEVKPEIPEITRPAVKPQVPKVPVREKAPAEKPKKSRAEKLSLILKENPELDTAEKLLAYLNEYDPHLLDAISGEKQLGFLRDFIFLGYETIPLPKQVLEQLTAPGMYAGRRTAEIRKARRMQPRELLAHIAEKVKQGITRSKWGIAYSTYSDIEKSGGLPRPGNLFDISRELKIDPIFIIDGRDWDSASCDLADHEKMQLCRLRKGWTLDKCALGLKSKLSTVQEWEKAKRVPNPEQRAVIRKVYVDNSLYKKADEIEAAEAREVEARAAEEKGWKFLEGVPRTKIHCFLAQHPEISGMAPSEIERAYGIPAASLRAFLLKNKTAADTYGIVLLEERKPPEKKPKAKPRPSIKERLATLPSAAKAKKPKITKEEAAEEAEEAEVTETKAGRRPGKVIIDEPEADYAIYIGGDIFECLRTLGDRELVDGMDIEDAIHGLEDICNKAGDLIEKETGPERQKKIMEQWRYAEAEVLLQRLKALVSTEICDWCGLEGPNPEISQRVTELTKGLADDSGKVGKIKGWVEANIKLVPEYEGCWKTKATETFKLLKGTDFNRANLIVAMLRSVGIPARYRITSLKKEGPEDMVAKEIAKAEEHIVVEALIAIEEDKDKITGDILREYQWLSLEPIRDERIAESFRLDNIDEFAAKKAKESRPKARIKTKGQGAGRGRANPWGQLKALKAIDRSG